MPTRVEEEQTTIWLLKRTVHMEILYCLDSTWYSFEFGYSGSFPAQPPLVKE